MQKGTQSVWAGQGAVRSTGTGVGWGEGGKRPSRCPTNGGAPVPSGEDLCFVWFDPQTGLGARGQAAAMHL